MSPRYDDVGLEYPPKSTSFPRVESKAIVTHPRELGAELSVVQLVPSYVPVRSH